MIYRPKFVATLAFSSVAPFGSGRAQSYPSRSITLIAPSAPEGSTDIVYRSLGDAVRRWLGLSAVVENNAGAGSTIGALALADISWASLDEPIVHTSFKCFMLSKILISSAEYESFARKTVDSERATLARLRLIGKNSS